MSQPIKYEEMQSQEQCIVECDKHNRHVLNVGLKLASRVEDVRGPIYPVPRKDRSNNLPAFGLGHSGAVWGQPAAAPTHAPKQGGANDAQGLIMQLVTN